MVGHLLSFIYFTFCCLFSDAMWKVISWHSSETDVWWLSLSLNTSSVSTSSPQGQEDDHFLAPEDANY